MKKFLLVITFLSIGISYAQEQEKNTIFVEEGRWGLGGRLSINSSNNEYGPELNSRSENFNIYAEPKVVYSIGNNWLIGLSIGYNYYKQENSLPSSDQESITHVLGLAPNIQKYFPIFDQFAFFLQGSLEYRHRWTKNSLEVRDTYVNKNYSALIRPGFSYFLNKQFALEATTGNLRYSRSYYTEDGMDVGKANDFYLDFGLNSFQFGAIYFFK